MPSDTEQPSCEQRIADNLDCRLADFEELLTTAEESDYERLRDYPLDYSQRTVHVIELRLDGPADWLEVFEGDDEIERIVYHFEDWFDHAERTVVGEDFVIAADFARALIPELRNP